MENYKFDGPEEGSMSEQVGISDERFRILEDAVKHMIAGSVKILPVGALINMDIPKALKQLAIVANTPAELMLLGYILSQILTAITSSVEKSSMGKNMTNINGAKKAAGGSEEKLLQFLRDNIASKYR